MTYFEEIDAWLASLLQGLPADQMDLAKKDIKAEILESYRNGQKAGVKLEKPFREEREAPAGRPHGFRDGAPKTSERSWPNRKRAKRQ